MAYIQPTNIPVSFQGGLQSKSDDFQVSPGSLLELENANFNKIGKLNKRYGYDILSNKILGGGVLTSAVAVDTFNNELNLFDNQNIYTYISGNDSWANRGPAISLINSNKQIIRTSAAQQLNPDSTILGGITVYAWEDSRGTCRYSVIDNDTDSYCIADAEIVGSLEKPKLIVFNNLVYVLYACNNNLSYRTINPNNPNLITEQVNIFADGYTGVSGNFRYDATVSNNNLYIAYFSNTGSVNLATINSSGTVIAETTVQSAALDSGAGNIYCVNIVSDSLGQIWISYCNGYAVYTTVYNSSLTKILNNQLIDDVAYAMTITGIESLSPGVLQLTYENLAIDTPFPYAESVTSVLVHVNGTIEPVGVIRSVGLASKAFRYKDNIYINLTHESTYQSTYFMCLLTNRPFTIVGKVGSQVGGGLITNGMLGSVDTIVDGVYIYANLIKGQFISEDNVTFSLLGVNSTTIDFTNVNKFNSVTQSNNLLFVGGILQSYDGVSVVEQNFHLYPEDITAAVSNFGGALSVGQYQYVVVYAWTDKFGQIQYSAPSLPITVTTSTITSSVTLTIPTLRLTAKDNVVIKIYRTQANLTSFNEVTSELAPFMNDKTVDRVQFVDGAADVNIIGNALVYTTGGILANSAPPSCSLITLYQDRVMISGLEDPHLIWYSKNKFDATNFNTIPVEFSSSLTIAVSQTGGPITALGLMDDKLIIFKKSSIFVLSGDGPNDAGGGGAFSAPQLVTNSIGCTNPNSVVLTKDGLMFQSDKGIWLLDRGLGPPSYIGAGVDDDAKEHIVSSAVVDPNDNLIIFTTFDGPALVYDYLIGQWSTYTNHQSIDAVVFNNKFTFCKPNGSIYVQNRNKFTDGDQFIKMEFITPWLSAAGMQGYQRIFRAYLLGQFRGAHTLDVSVSYDFNPDFGKHASIDATSISGGNQFGSDGYWGNSTPWGGTFQPYQFQINFDNQTCTSFRMKVSDNQDSPYTEGYQISNLSFEVGILPGSNRLPIKNKVGTR